MLVEVPLGDVVDRVTILLLKERHLSDEGALANVRRELTALGQAWRGEGHAPMQRLPQWAELSEVNGALWSVEDALREHEVEGDFGPEFVALARSVYQLNDRRAALKRAISLSLGSQLVEEKSYAGTGS